MRSSTTPSVPADTSLYQQPRGNGLRPWAEDDFANSTLGVPALGLHRLPPTSPTGFVTEESQLKKDLMGQVGEWSE